MASQRVCTLPSDPDYLLSLVCEIDESDSKDDFEGFLDKKDGPTIMCDKRLAATPPLILSL